MYSKYLAFIFFAISFIFLVISTSVSSTVLWGIAIGISIFSSIEGIMNLMEHIMAKKDENVYK